MNRRLIDDLERRFVERPDHLEHTTDAKDEETLSLRLFMFLRSRVDHLRREILHLRKCYRQYTKRYSRATTLEDRMRHMLEFVADMGASPSQIREDRKAFNRWFGHDAIVERYQRRHAITERSTMFALGRLGSVAERVMEASDRESDVVAEWRNLGLEETLRPFFTYDGDTRVATAAFQALAKALRALPQNSRETSVREATLQFIYRSAMYPKLDVWLQSEALALLAALSTDSFETVLSKRLTEVQEGDDFFVRQRAVALLGKHLSRVPALVEMIPVVVRDPSPFVRQGLARGLEDAPIELADQWLGVLAREDEAGPVRAAALLAGLRLLEREEIHEGFLETLTCVLCNEKDDFVLRTAMHVAAEGSALLVSSGSSFAESWSGRLLPCLEEIHVSATSVATRRRAAMARERIWCEVSTRARELRQVLHPYLAPLRSGYTCGVPRRIIQPADLDLCGRVLSVLTQEEFGCDLEKRFFQTRLTRGHILGFRMWRFLHECRTPSPDKRQAFRHTVGRKFYGSVRAPSTVMAELAPTRVPGEPRFLAEEGGWRPYLPLVDELLSSMGSGWCARPTLIYTSEGVTEVVPPSRFLDRWLATYRLTTDFSDYATLRNWEERTQEDPRSYLRSLERLGFGISFRPHRVEQEQPASVDPKVERFFPSAAPILGTSLWSGSDLWNRMHEYFVSVYDNSLLELTVFTAAATSFFLGRHILSNHSVRRHRDNIPLVVGGWGTRGKSGTERLKAALFSALGYGVVSKTTGCEAMFLYSYPFGETRELFLFRSYDKATIWEQEHVMRLADELGADVFLWECMALTPAYVELLQRHWVRDDISTITNTYPDHEDLQGPAGYNIPEVISLFIPRHAKVVTTEEDMYPILREQAGRVGSDIRKVSWLDIGLLTQDVIDRFPYDEHPNNIALVLALADELGVEADFALKAMADDVVADLGVLKTSPIATVDSRRLQFTNGCSANESHGATGNWNRSGFAGHDPVADPGTWLTTVVNNRADRVPRSRVFSKLLVEDFAADRHFLIGGNLQGMTGYIHDAWSEFSASVSLKAEASDREPTESLLYFARYLRLPTEQVHVAARVRNMLLGQGLEDTDVQEFLALTRDDDRMVEFLKAKGLEPDRVEATTVYVKESLESLGDFETLRERVLEGGGNVSDALDEQLRAYFWKWFEKKIVLVEDYHISGDQLVHLIATSTPPGYLNRIMGLQNIKGTGLDFVYRWQAWEACYRACALLRDRDSAQIERGLRTLSSFAEYGVLCEEHVSEALREAQSSPAFQNESFQAELALVQSNFQRIMTDVRQRMQAVRKKASGREKFLASVEGFVDAGDAVRRRKRANRIYKELIAERISCERAAKELQAINKRQKGGWLHKRFAAFTGGVGRSLARFFVRRLKSTALSKIS